MNKKGFTLIEIIISISLILIIGTSSFIGFNMIQKNNKVNTLNEMSNNIMEAVNVFIEVNKETKEQLYNNKNGAVIPLVRLEQEGLIDFQNLDIKDEYVVAMLSNEYDCNSPSMIQSWNFESGKILYVCTNGREYANIKEKLKGDDGLYTAKGTNPNNWVEFEVQSDDSLLAYFPNNENKDLWRIMNINQEGNIKLIYNQTTLCNNSSDSLIDSLKQINYDVDVHNEGIFETQYNSLNYICGRYALCWTYATVDGWNSLEILSDVTENNKKDNLFKKINNNNWIIPSDYLFSEYLIPYTSTEPRTDIIVDLVSNFFKEYKMGVISNYNEYIETFFMGKSWLISNDERYAISNIVSSGRKDIYFDKNGFGFDHTFKEADTDGYNNIISTYNYKPIVVLNKNVQIIENNTSTCKGDKIQGTKECPYKLECNNC